MRTKKSIINSVVNIIALIMTFIPNMIIRKVFLDTLGSEMLGLTSLYTNIISWLSIFDMGIGSAIVYSLYKPYANNDYQAIKSYINFYGKFYKKVGLLIITSSIIISPFMKYFINDNINYSIASIGFILFAINTFISYMFSHRLCILNVAQEAYVITIGTSFSRLIISILQVIILKIYPNFFMYIIIQIIVNIIYFLTMNIYISKRFGWINEKSKELDQLEKDNLTKNIKSLFMHQIGTLVLNCTDNMVISKFLGLTTLAMYTNYQIVIGTLQNLVNSMLNGITSSLGNLIAEGDIDKSYSIHKKVFFMSFWITSFIVISLYNTLDQFIALWVGKNNIIDNFTFSIILINVYFFTMRGSVEQFKMASGNYYQDRYAPIIEAVINLVTSLILVRYIGLTGVFIGTLISNFTVVFWVKPYIVYKYVFDKNLVEYFKMYFRYLLIASLPLFITNILTSSLKYNYTVTDFILNCSINIVTINIIYIIVFYKSEEFKYFINILNNITKKIFKKNLNKAS